MRDVLAYFQEHFRAKRLGDLTWAHAVNSQEGLQRALADPQIMLIESDIRVSAAGEVIAAHPPLVESDLSFTALLEAVQASKQGLKLDFKDEEAVLPSLSQLQSRHMRQPVLLNADILPGMGARSPTVQAKEFLHRCKSLYPQGFLSIGWTTGRSPLTPYTRENVDEMLKLCQDHNLQQVTFPVRAAYLPASWTPIARLLQVEGYSLTIWDGGPLPPELVQWLRTETDPALVCYDCQDEYGQPFRFDISPAPLY